MPAAYTHRNLAEVEDSAPRFGFEETQEARFANDDLETQSTGVSFHRVKPGKRQAFAHRHEDAEEIYLVLSGSGRAKLDDDIVELTTLDALRISPGVVRAVEGGPEGIELVAFGPRHEGDGELIQDWWTE